MLPPKPRNRKAPPPEQLRVELMSLKARGVPFDRAWEMAMRKIKWPCDREPKAEWRAAIRATKEVWRDCYHDEGPPLTLEELIRALASDAEMPLAA